MSVAAIALRLLPQDMQVHVLAVAAAEGLCSRETALSDAAQFGIVTELLAQFETDDAEQRIRLGARYLDPHGALWAVLSDSELRDRAAWCMRPEHHAALQAERNRRVDGLDAIPPTADDIPF
jgi:hypothetical protein